MNMQLTLYGARPQRLNALALLENCPRIRRVDALSDGRTLRLTMNDPMPEGELLSLLRASGVSGFRIG
ncbi:MAG: hypothetical protein MR821_06035 [Clostridiales bacterium]|nr:hypothetical protein [Clostridiales bacterium]